MNRSALRLHCSQLARIGLLGLLCFLALTTKAETNIRIAVLLSNDSPPFQQFSQQLEQKLNQNSDNKFQLQSYDLHELEKLQSELRTDNKPRLLISAGSKAGKAVMMLKAPPPVLYTLLPRPRYEELSKANTHCRIIHACSALFLEQPLERHIKALRQTLPKAVELGVILGPQSAYLLPYLQQLALKNNLDLNYAKTNGKQNIIAITNEIMESSDVLLALPDNKVFNRHTAKGILLSTYRRQKPLVAYSAAFVKAGALYSVFSDPAKLGIQTAEIIAQSLRGKGIRLPAAQYPKYFSIKINHAVARSLGIELQSESELMTALKSKADD